MNDLYIQHRGGGTPEDAAIQPAENETKYPEPTMFGRMPAHGLFLRHARNISVSNVEIRSLEKDLRPAFAVQDVEGADFFRIRAPYTKDVPTFALRNVDHFTVSRSMHVPDTQVDHVDQQML